MACSTADLTTQRSMIQIDKADKGAIHMSCISKFLSAYCFVCFTIVVSSALAEMPRVLPVGQFPNDRRLGSSKTLDGYFPCSLPASREAWQRRAAELRRQVLVAAGLWPMPAQTPLNAAIHGKVDRKEYTVEKVFFESYPGFFVTGNLYRPKNRPDKLPCILCPHGHWPEGRFQDAGPKDIRTQIVEGAERFEIGGRYPQQARCVQLARMG